MVCQKWDSNPRPQKWTATWTQRLRPLGHPDVLGIRYLASLYSGSTHIAPSYVFYLIFSLKSPQANDNYVLRLKQIFAREVASIAKSRWSLNCVVRMAERSKAPDSRIYLLCAHCNGVSVLVHECGRGFESHFWHIFSIDVQFNTPNRTSFKRYHEFATYHYLSIHCVPNATNYNSWQLRIENAQVLPRFELGSLDSKSRVLTITP